MVKLLRALHLIMNVKVFNTLHAVSSYHGVAILSVGRGPSVSPQIYNQTTPDMFSVFLCMNGFISNPRQTGCPVGYYCKGFSPCTYMFS